MDPISIGGLIVGVLSLVAAFGAWFWPRSGDKPAVAAPAPLASHSDPPSGLLVTIGLAMIGVEPEPMMVIMVEASNPNTRPRKVVYVGLELESKKQVAFTRPGSDKPLPCLLQETDNIHMWTDVKGIARAMCEAGLPDNQKVRSVVRDSYDTKHYSQWTDFEPSKWLKG